MRYIKSARLPFAVLEGAIYSRYELLRGVNGLLVALLVLLLAAQSARAVQNEQDKDISGSIVTGFRVVNVDLASADNRITVYRGDYVKFAYPQDYGSQDFEMEQLQYKATLDPDPEKAPFFKMKSTGVFSFRLGEATGSVTVIDLVRPNYTEVTADEAAELLKNLHPFILDVRTPAENEQIRIDGTYLIPIQELQGRIGELEGRKNEDVFVYCATGNRSTVAARILADRGFKRIYNLRYGVYDWARRGHPYTTGK